METLVLRAAENSDEEFLEDLFGDVRGGEFAAAGLSPEQLGPLLAMQYRAQKASSRWSFPDAEELVIESNGEKIGRLLVARDGGKTHLIDIFVRSDFRGRGAGGRVLEMLKAEAESVSLRVFIDNRGARRLYERHGFRDVRTEGNYFEMEWKNAR